MEDEKTDPQNPIAKALQPLLARMFREHREEMRRMLGDELKIHKEGLVLLRSKVSDLAEKADDLQNIALDHEERISKIELMLRGDSDPPPPLL